jgi:hypothetical protein
VAGNQNGLSIDPTQPQFQLDQSQFESLDNTVITTPIEMYARLAGYEFAGPSCYVTVFGSHSIMDTQNFRRDEGGEVIDVALVGPQSLLLVHTGGERITTYSYCMPPVPGSQVVQVHSGFGVMDTSQNPCGPTAVDCDIFLVEDTNNYLTYRDPMVHEPNSPAWLPGGNYVTSDTYWFLDVLYQAPFYSGLWLPDGTDMQVCNTVIQIVASKMGGGTPNLPVSTYPYRERMEEKNMKNLAAFLILLCVGLQAQAPHRFGAIDSVSIPDKNLNIPRETAIAVHMSDHSQPPTDAEIQAIQDKMVCSKLQIEVMQATRDRAKRELGVSASKSEVEAARPRYPTAQNSQTQYRERLQALVVGLTAVYDQGRDPEQVYQQLVAPHHVVREDWQQNLYTGRTKEARQKLAQQLAAATPEAFAKAEANFDPRYAVELDKLDAAIDAQLAANDPKFKAYLSEYNAHVTHPAPNRTHVVDVPTGVQKYLDQKRNAWWMAERAKLIVSLSDPSLYAACNLAVMGVTVPAH